MAPTYQELVERLEHVENLLKGKATLPLDSIPMAALSERLTDTMTPEGDQLLLPASVGIDSLAEVPHARVFNSASESIAIATHTPLAHNVTDFKSGGNSIQVNLTTHPTRITATEAGVYVVTASCMMARTDVSFLKVSILKNAAGTYAGAAEQQTVEGLLPAGGVHARTLTTLVRLEVNDHVEAYVYYSAPATSDTFIDFGGRRNQVLTAVRVSIGD